MAEFRADTPVQFLKGVGPHLGQLLQKKAVYTVWGFLFFLPHRYVDRRTTATMDQLQEGVKQTVIGTVQSIRIRPLGKTKKRLLEIHLSDGQQQIQVTLFQFQEGFIRKRFPEGSSVLVYGEPKRFRQAWSFVHPEMEPWDADEGEQPFKIFPVYSLTEGLHQKTVRRIFSENRQALLSVVMDDSRSVRASGAVQLSLQQAFEQVHFPGDDANVDDLNQQRSPAHKRIIYDEFFYLQLGLKSKRYKMAQNKALPVVPVTARGQQLRQHLPFALTNAQDQVLQDVQDDLQAGRPLNRLVQGDVGSGKTIVSLMVALMFVDAGYQVALMAPTEILAEQHYRGWFQYEEVLGIRVELLTGSTSSKERQRILYDLAQGKTSIVVGTHALITDDVQFSDLGLVVIDEQHRFGVMQRSKLKNKMKMLDGREGSPHMLFLTATPIPRTLSMCVYGDLDVSVMRELPPGRTPVKTQALKEAGREKLYKFVAGELLKGHQAYFIYPLVEETEKMDLKDATFMAQELSARFGADLVGSLHGKMKPKDKELMMSRFKAGELKLLVSTTVVEVGVDVPQATVMVIEHAERFGLSQLHQLRGRVGRSHRASYCFLMTGKKCSLEGWQRLKAMEKFSSGFDIAEEDLKFRGPGEFLGTRQSGHADFRLAHLVRDESLLRRAQERAQEILDEDPDLQHADHQRLKMIMMDRWGRRLDLSLV